MANTKITSHVIANDAVTVDMITDAAVTADKLHATLDLSGKTLTLPSAQAATTQSASDNTTKVATTAFVTTAIANLSDSAPAALNTLNEIAAALGDDANYASTTTAAIATKAPLANPTFTTAINGGDNVKLQLGASQDLQIYHNGSNADRIDSSSTYLILEAANTIIRKPGGSEDYAKFLSDGAVELYHNNVKKFETTATGATLNGTGALKLPQGTTAQRPSAATGQMRWNTSDGSLEVYNGSAWTAVGTGSSNKVLDTFTGDGSTTAFTLTVTPANEDALIVFIDGVYQEKGDYALSNAVLTLDTAPASGEKLAVHITTASVHDGTSAVNQQFTATNGQTAFTLSADPKSENNTQVYINGVYQQKTDYAVSGTTLTFDTGVTLGDIVEVNMFTVTTLGNTDTVSEGTSNLYHTTARARGAISVSGNALSYNSSTGVITSAYEETPVFTGTVTAPLVDAAILDGENFKINGAQGSDGQVMTSTGSGVAWEALGINDLSNANINSGDPASNTNPSTGVGTLWINSTSGEAYVLTDATTNANAWTNIGGGEGNIGVMTDATGGTKTTSGSYTVHTFLTSGTFTPNGPGTVDYLVVAGGGSGGAQNAGGGGAGGFRTATGLSVTAQAYTVTIGAGGAASTGSSVGNDGTNSTFSTITSIGGGGGGSDGSTSGRSGGSGGGANQSGTAGAGTSGQGNAGGAGGSNRGGGGGGATNVGTASSTKGGNGGTGTQSSIDGTNYYYAGGGGGATYPNGNGGTGGAGGGGGGTTAAGGGGSGGAGGAGRNAGGAGGNNDGNAGAAGANTGGGGGAGRGTSDTGGAGGSGIVIVRYLT